jgi:hypothetical protein
MNTQPSISPQDPAIQARFSKIRQKHVPIVIVFLLAFTALETKAVHKHMALSPDLIEVLTELSLGATLAAFYFFISAIKKEFGFDGLNEAYQFAISMQRERGNTLSSTRYIAVLVICVAIGVYGMKMGWFPSSHDHAQRSTASVSTQNGD